MINSIHTHFSKTALKIEPNNAKFNFRLGTINYYLGKTDAAIASFTKAATDILWNDKAMNCIEELKRWRKMYSLPHFETLRYPPKKIDFLPKHDANNPFCYNNSRIFIYSMDIQPNGSSADCYDIKKDEYRAVDNALTAPPTNYLYIEMNTIHIGQTKVYYPPLEFNQSKEMIYSPFMNGIWSLDVRDNGRREMIHCDLNEKMINYVGSFPGAEGRRFCAVLGCKHLTFLFIQAGLGNPSWSFWCYDVWMQKKWIKCKYSFPAPFGFCKAVVDVDLNNVHFLNVSSKENERFHFKMSLFQLIPDELSRFYSAKYEKLVHGVIRKTNESRVLSRDVPFVLVQLVATFYPLFM